MTAGESSTETNFLPNLGGSIFGADTGSIFNAYLHEGKPVHRMNNTAWKKWRLRAGLPMVRIHDLKHTFGHRLRAAGVSFEDRQDLLGHRSDRITTHYSAPDIKRLLKAAEMVVGTRTEPVLQAVSHPKSPQSTALLAHNRV
jgi:integrase